ncbi:phosphate/phosphite/phosphonate ABC transporter substrate-binding protein [Bradyrhizobium prioriisuperbiae]|uniref:phosphate/phosphite/phosphonate ABC transporter substrate-binding protein n=1 Tax=Bradyrhizobium prioriisuperbiae TaxID=2854389 RepID=UPI0028EBB25A|nr:PhnD/SsuA/transferrin family substrate-binding protein [Bradyrhizobium prioritasuperba]
MLAVPCYRWAGCEGATHRGYFIVRTDDDAQTLGDLRGRIFGCNNHLSNSGMNLPRLTLARLAGFGHFFSDVKMTGSHGASVEQLGSKAIDVCSIDCVTWGLLGHHDASIGRQFRVLDETVPSPSLPFVTSVSTPEDEVKVLTDVLHEIVRDPHLRPTLDVLGLMGLAAPDVAAYERLSDYEREAARRGYEELQ